MIKPDFRRISNITLSPLIKAGDSELCWREFLVAVSFFTNHCSFRINEDEISEVTKSLQNWTFRRNFTDYMIKDSQGNSLFGDINLGDIFLADLGLSYETAYSHPVVVLEKVGNKLLVIPSTTSVEKVNNAYHPDLNVNGDKWYRRVEVQNGFECDCALMLNSISVISKGRLLEKKGQLNENINNSNSIFSEIKESIFKLYLGRFYQDYKNISRENEILKEEIKALKETQKLA